MRGEVGGGEKMREEAEGTNMVREELVGRERMQGEAKGWENVRTQHRGQGIRGGKEEEMEKGKQREEDNKQV